VNVTTFYRAGRADKRADIAVWLLAEIERVHRDCDADPTRNRRLEIQAMRAVVDGVLRGAHQR